MIRGRREIQDECGDDIQIQTIESKKERMWAGWGWTCVHGEQSLRPHLSKRAGARHVLGPQDAFISSVLSWH